MTSFKFSIIVKRSLAFPPDVIANKDWLHLTQEPSGGNEVTLLRLTFYLSQSETSSVLFGCHLNPTTHQIH